MKPRVAAHSPRGVPAQPNYVQGRLVTEDSTTVGRAAYAASDAGAHSEEPESGGEGGGRPA